MMIGMPPSDHHRFILTSTDTIVELRWRGVTPPPSRGLRARVAALLAGPRPSPWHLVDHAAFDRTVDQLATDTDAAVQELTRLGYEVTVTAPPARAAA